MMMRTKYTLIACLIGGILGNGFAQNTSKNYRLLSPNGKMAANITCGENLSYSILYQEDTLLLPSKIALRFENKEFPANGAHPKTNTRQASEEIVSPFYRTASFTTSYNELTLAYSNGNGVIFRAYNEGLAYRFYTTFKKETYIQSETAEFNFAADHTVYMSHTTNAQRPFAMACQNIYEVSPLSQVDSLPAFLPITVDYGKGLKMTLLESDLEAYPGMFVQTTNKKSTTNKNQAFSLKGIFSQLPATTDYYPWRKQLYVKEYGENIAHIQKGKHSYPWRVLAITEKDTEMPVNNLVYALASPNRIGDISWIKTGKVAWDWWNDWGLSGVPFQAGINMDTYKYYIDFASRNGIEFIILDEGWYLPAGGDMLQTIPEIDLPELVRYGKEKSVDIVLWTVFNVLDDQLEAACQKYADMGIAGFKVDFLDRDDQTAIEMVYRIADMAARYHLTLDFHGICKPTGINRTYPNVLNYESVFGMEEVKWTDYRDMPRYDVTFPFIRMMAGSVDYTPGAMTNATKKDFHPIYYNPMSMGTRCHQLATYIVYDSPFTMLCDAPTNYEKEAEYTNFLTSLPVTTDETIVLDGCLGEYIVTARRHGLNWYIGGMTNWTARDLEIDFSFLPENRYFTATIYTDGVNADKQGEDYQVKKQVITRHSRLKIHLASGGGFALRLLDDEVSEVPSSLGVSPFYKKYLNADGIAITTSENVADAALYQARTIILYMLSKRQDIKDRMISQKCRVMIVGAQEEVCEIPEYAHICDNPENIAYWNKRARGFGGAPEDDLSASCGEENLLCYPQDRYVGENIMIHEFAHLFHLIGIAGLDAEFDEKLEAMRLAAIEKGLWDKTYAVSNKEEYFAECVQSFFNCNRYSETPNGVHNAINRRDKLKNYDPEMYQLLCRYFDEIEIPICNEIHE